MDIEQQLRGHGLRRTCASEAAKHDEGVDWKYLWALTGSPIYAAVESDEGRPKVRRLVLRHVLCGMWLCHRQDGDGTDWYGVRETSEIDDYTLVRLDEVPEEMLDPWLASTKTTVTDDDAMKLIEELGELCRDLDEPSLRG